MRGWPRLIAVAAVGLLQAAAAQAQLGDRRWPLSALAVTDRIRVPAGPGWLAVGYGSIWLSKSRSRTVYRIDPVSDRVLARIPVGSDAELGIGIGLGAVWIADPTDRSLTQIDAASNRVVRTVGINLPAEPEGSIGVGFGAVWLLSNENGTDSGTLSRFDPALGRITDNIPVKAGSHAAVVAYGSIWVTNSGAGSVQRIDPRINQVVAEIPVRASPRFMVAGAGSLWVLSQGDGTLARIDPRTNRVAATIEVGVPGPGGDLAVGNGYVWVAAEGTPLTQIDPASNAIVRQFFGGHELDTLRVGFDAAWLVDESSGEILKVSVRQLTLPAH